MLRAVRLCLIAIMTLVVGPSAAAGQAQPPVHLTILHDTHLHGSFESADRVTLAHYAGLVQRLKTEYRNSLFVGVGDDIAPSVLSSVFAGEHMVAALNAAGLDVNTFGNHEFDYGPDVLRERIQQSVFPWVSANVRDRASGGVFAADLGVRTFMIQRVGGVGIGLTGFAPFETPVISSPGPEVVVLDPIEAAREVVPQMRAAGAQIVVVLSHLAWRNTEALAAGVPGIDVIVGDHDSTVLPQPKVINGTIVSRRGHELALLGQLDLEVSAGRITAWTYTEHRLGASDQAEPGVAAVMADYQERLSEALEGVAGTTGSPLDARRTPSRTRETGLGNLIADALREWGQADVAVQNGGGIRADRVYEPGVLTRRDLVAMLPFTNYAAVVRVSGETLLSMLELSVSTVEEEHGRFLQVSGLAFAYDPAAERGARIWEVHVGGAPLDPSGQYTLVVNDFMLGGGDGYSMLGDGEVLLPAQAGPLISNVLADYLATGGAVEIGEEGRIRAGPAT